MKLNYVRPYNSINGPVTNVEIADFVVMSGPNGSGKSNLLEAIQQGATEIDGITAGAGSPAPAVRLFALAQLVAVAEGAQSAANFRDRWLQLEQQTKSHITQLTGHPNNVPAESDQLEEHVCNALVGNRQLTQAALDRMLSESGKRLIDFSVDDFRRHSPLIVGVRDPFSMSISELFLTYHQRLERNQFYQWREATKPGAEHLSLTDEEFAATYGPPPWELLNETLSLVGLNYRFRGPTGSEEDLMYEALLVHIDTETEVRTAQLSSGEKTLLAVAMSLYTGSRLGDAIELPKVLLLDEADASLHPSMVQSLLRVLDDIFSQRYGVKVMLTTHAPTTVALAPEESLYTIRRVGSPRLQPASRDEALSSLLVGLPTLSVRNENRRQVFVESEHDEACYQELVSCASPNIGYTAVS
jgi:ABC-type branched-subunit amino acid transport system ATPase component